MFQSQQLQVAAMRAQHTQMLQQIHQRQYQQLQASRQASQKKRAAAGRTAEMSASSKAKPQTTKPAKSSAPSA